MNSFHGSAHPQRSCQAQSRSTLKELLYKMEMPCSSYHIHIMLLSKIERSCFLLQNVWLRPFKHLCVFWRHIDRCWLIWENIRYWQKHQSNVFAAGLWARDGGTGSAGLPLPPRALASRNLALQPPHLPPPHMQHRLPHMDHGGESVFSFK